MAMHLNNIHIGVKSCCKQVECDIVCCRTWKTYVGVVIVIVVFVIVVVVLILVIVVVSVKTFLGNVYFVE